MVNTSILNKVKQEAELVHHDFNWSSDPDLVNQFLDINQQALFDDLANDNIRTELDHLFRYNQESAEKHKDGLSAKCMDFPSALMRSVFQKYEKWKKPFKKKLLQKTYMSKFKGTQTLGWFTGNFETTEDFLQAGRMLARAWLRITEDGCYIQPFGSLITNEKAYAQINNLLKTKPNQRKIWMIFRVGHSKEPARSERLDLDTILL